MAKLKEFEGLKPPKTETTPLTEYFTPVGGGVELNKGELRSPNFVRRNFGWMLDYLGNAFFKTVELFDTETTDTISINKSNSGNSINIVQTANDASDTIGMKMSIANAGAGVEFAFRFDGDEKGHTAAGDGGFVSNSTGTFTAVGYIRINIAGDTYYVPYGTIT